MLQVCAYRILLCAVFASSLHGSRLVNNRFYVSNNVYLLLERHTQCAYENLKWNTTTLACSRVVCQRKRPSNAHVVPYSIMNPHSISKYTNTIYTHLSPIEQRVRSSESIIVQGEQQRALMTGISDGVPWRCIVSILPGGPCMSCRSAFS